AIFKEVGNCVMPKEGIFARVISGGQVSTGMQFEYQPRIFKTLIITLSDRASSGIYEDRSGPRIKELMDEWFSSKNLRFSIESVILPDDPEQLREWLIRARAEKYDMVFTTGGTGIGPRDFTPDTLRPFIDKEIPGVMEMIRMKYGTIKPNALLSRGIAGVMGECLVYTLPGSLKAVNEYFTEIGVTLQHSIYMLHGLDLH
ncbi:MAG TPA: molybdenum cofactor synthesis domain-containing protein, partial [Bacteroidales bacterium]|nr:molybdenum cofactor synthesis domain-containing protein [Bacteroidales bacterium]